MGVLNARSLQRSAVIVAVFAVTAAALLFLGCASSEVVEFEESSVIDSLQTSIDSLITENSKLRSQISRLEQENRNLVAQRAELETKLAEEQERSKTPTPPSRGISNPQPEYDHGLSLFREKNYQEALSVFMGLLNGGVPENLESNCDYWIGESYYGMKQFKDAMTHFEKVFGYSRSTKKDDAQIMIANCHRRMGDQEQARQEYQKLIDQYPASPYVQRAKDKIAKLK